MLPKSSFHRMRGKVVLFPVEMAIIGRRKESICAASVAQWPNIARLSSHRRLSLSLSLFDCFVLSVRGNFSRTRLRMRRRDGHPHIFIHDFPPISFIFAFFFPGFSNRPPVFWLALPWLRGGEKCHRLYLLISF
jgi:hypothetical protein